MERLNGADGLLHQFDSFLGGSLYKNISSMFSGDLKSATQHPRAHECFISWELPTFIICCNFCYYFVIFLCFV